MDEVTDGLDTDATPKIETEAKIRPKQLFVLICSNLFYLL